MNTKITMPAMPAMPNKKRNKASRECACGCRQLTKSTWFSGHDGRATGWATRIERGLIKLEDVPANEQAGAKLMLARHAAKAREEAKQSKAS